MAESVLRLVSGDVELAIDPWAGGGITSFTWREIDIFRSHRGDKSPIDLASFPLVPFCNRIANGRVMYGDCERSILVSQKDVEKQHSIHGLGWISPWATREISDNHAVLSLNHDGAIWPWTFEATQHIRVFEGGYSHTLSVTNRDETPMPAGLGLHPYFPRSGAKLELAVDGYWQTDADRLPSQYHQCLTPPDWFAEPGLDNCFSGRSAPIHIHWPSHKLTIEPSPDLSFSHVYSPPGESFFCVEPVSHIPDAVNSALGVDQTGLSHLEKGERFEVACEEAH